jgi:8-oxo-dGTP diphosphatase
MSMRVVAAISIHDGRVLCCRRNLENTNGGLWEFPGGKVERNETDHDALVREINEELSQQICVGAFFSDSHLNLEMSSLELKAYFVNGISRYVVPGDSHSEVKWVPVDELETLNWAPADIPIVNRLTTELRIRGKNNVF